MGDVDGLIAGLRGEGAVASRGQFTLDAEQAREKLRMFQLADPHRWIVLVVQALLARGAQRVDVAIDTDDVRVVADARAFSADELSDLPNVLLGENVVAPGLRELALGLNAALALDPRWLRLESVDGTHGVQLEQRPGERDRVEAIASAAPGVRVQVKRRLGLGLVARFFRIGRASVREHELLRRHCGFATAEIVLDGLRLPVIARDDDVTSWRELVVDGVVRGELGISRAGGEGRIELLRHQLWMSTHSSSDPAFIGVRARLDVSAMRTDVSMAEVVRDAEYEALLAAVHRSVEASLAELVAGYAEGEPVPAWLDAHVTVRIAARGLVVHPVSPVMAAWMRVPIWRRLDGTRVSTAELDASESVPFSLARPDSPPVEVTAIVDGRDGRDVRLAALFGERCRDDTALVEHAAARAVARRAFEQRVHPSELPHERAYSASIPIVTATGVVGTIGMHGGGNERGWIRVIREGRLLVELPVEFPFARMHAVIHGELNPDEMFSDVVRDDAFAVAMHATLNAYCALVRSWAGAAGKMFDHHTREALCRHLRLMEVDDAAIDWLGTLGIDKLRGLALLERLGRPWRLRPDELDGVLEHPLVRAELFEDGSGAPLDLLTIAAHARQHGHVLVIAKGRPHVAATPELVVRTDEKRMRLLTGVFGATAILRAGDQFERWLTRDRFLAQTSASVFEPPLPCVLGPFGTVLDGRAASIGLSAVRGKPAQVRLFVEKRALALVQVPCLLTGLALAIDSDLTWVSARFDGTVEPAAAPGLALAVAAATGAIAERVAMAASDGVWARSVLVIELARIAWPEAVWLQAWLALCRELGEAEGTRSYSELLGLRDHHDPDALREELRSYLEQSVAPMPARVAVAVPRAEQATTMVEQAIRVVERTASWTHVACFPSVDGGMRSLADLIAAVVSDTRIDHVDAVRPSAPADALILEASSAQLLAAVLGSQRMRDLGPDLRAEQRRAEFEQRPQRGGLGLDDPAPLVEVEVDSTLLGGTLGLPRALPGGMRGRVVVCHRRRDVCIVDPFDHTSYLGTLDGVDLGAASGFTALTAAELALVRTCCERHRGALLRALLRAWGDSEALDRLCAAWIRHLLVQLVPRSRASHVVLAREGVAELAELPLFVDTLGVPMTLAMLREEVDAHGNLGVVEEAGLRLDRRLVHARDALELAQLRTIFDVVVDCEAAARARLELERALESAPVLPSPGADAFARIRVDDRELEGELWLDPHTHDGSTVWLGHEGRAIEQRQISKMFPCRGGITGAGVQLAPQPGRVRLTRGGA
ncbi:MAG: hypothetical protein IAG13_37335, partial [Deltaproteobacteria bacterium]|nr:hypothetical protein [Nannocystaceae bacterium]